MKIDIQCLGMLQTDAIRSHVEDKLSKLERLLPGEIDVGVILNYESGNQKEMHHAEVTLRIWGQDVVSKTSGEDLYKAVTEVAEQVTNQVRRLKDKRASARKGGTSVRTMEDGFAPQTEDETKD